jgi:hypothetical protein
MSGLDRKEAKRGRADPVALLSEVKGPTPEELARGRRLMLTRLAQLREASVSRQRRGLMRPAGAIAALLAFSVVAAGAAAAGGVISAGSVLDLLQDENHVAVPNAALDHLADLPKAGLPDLPTAVNSNAGLQGQGLGVPADAAAHGEAVSSAVGDAIAANDAGQGRGAAVSQAACQAATGRDDLPAQAQGHGPSSPVDCTALGAASAGSNGVTSDAGANQGKPPASVPPSTLLVGNAGDNPVGAPPDGAGQGAPPVVAPPTPPGPPAGVPPVAAPPSGVGQPSDVGSPVQPPLPDEAQPPVDPGTPGPPVDLPPPPPGGKPSGIPTPPPH